MKYNALYSKKNDDNFFEIFDGCIKLNIVFHPMAIFLGSMENKFLPGILVILRIISNFSMIMYAHFLVKYYT